MRQSLLAGFSSAFSFWSDGENCSIKVLRIGKGSGLMRSAFRRSVGSLNAVVGRLPRCSVHQSSSWLLM